MAAPSSSTYSTDRKLPSCIVAQELLMKLDTQVREQLPGLVPEPRPALEARFTIIGGDGSTEMFDNVAAYTDGTFPNSTKSVSLRYQYGGCVHMTITFSSARDGSSVRISAHGISVRDRVDGMAEGIRRSCTEFRQPWYTTPFIAPWAGLIGAVGFFLGIPALSGQIEGLAQAKKTAAVLTYALLFACFIFAHKLTPFSRMETRKNREIDKWRWAFASGLVMWLIFHIFVSKVLKLA